LALTSALTLIQSTFHPNKTQDVIGALEEVIDGETWMLHLTGNLKDGTPIEGRDCIEIKKKGKK
jgi:hypothetical protein